VAPAGFRPSHTVMRLVTISPPIERDASKFIRGCQSALTVLAANSDINAANIGLVGLAQTGLEYL
jgi:hypothetical protein